MLIKSIVLIFSLQLVLTTPQFVTFKDGKIGVNFGGYHAEAGLGGLLTGNAAHGGLSASAGTPWGPRAAAGLNGGVDGRAAGTAYAGAQLNPSVGASSVISGSTGDEQHGFAGAEAHTPGKTKSVVSTNSAFGGGLGGFVAGSEGSSAHTDGAQVTQSDQNVQTIKTSSVQKIKPHKKFTLVKNEIIEDSVIRHQRNDDDNSNNSNNNLDNTSTDGQQHSRVVATTSTTNSGSNNQQTQSGSNNSLPSIKTTLAAAVGGPSAEWQEVAKIISINRQRHRERKRKEQQERQQGRRQPSHISRRAHNVQRNKFVVNSYTTQPAHVALDATSLTSSANSNTKSNVARSKHVVNSVYKEVRLPSGSTVITHENPANDQPIYHNYHQQPVAASNYETETVGVRAHAGGLVGSVLNIPIGILKSLQESLAGIQLQKSITYTKLA